ncbi:MAG: HIT family protein [Cytophagales bacterium]|nr:MAG: HIT family protein [Cytophagales bacterium]
MASIFTKIIEGQIPAHKIAENEYCLAFLDIAPITQGHTLVVPKKEIDYLYDLEDELLTELNLFAKKVAQAIKKAMLCQRVGVIVAGFEVPHAHIHLIPANDMSVFTFEYKKPATQDELAKTADLIRKYFE